VNVNLKAIDRFRSTMAHVEVKDRSPIDRVTEFLDSEIGEVLADAIASCGDVRIQTGGPLGGAPLLKTAVNGAPLGASASVAYAHPNPTMPAGEPPVGPFDLLVIDETFGDESSRVRSAVEAAAARSSTTLEVLAFNSDSREAELSHEDLGKALQSCSSAILFCHVNTRVGQAPAAAIVTGLAGRLRVEALAALDLRQLNEVAVMGCGSGRADPFVGDVTVAHAVAMAGARQVLYTLWPITASHGADLAVALVTAHAGGMSTPERLAREFRDERDKASALALIRP
jgi:hypothetical protein